MENMKNIVLEDLQITVDEVFEVEGSKTIPTVGASIGNEFCCSCVSCW